MMREHAVTHTGKMRPTGMGAAGACHLGAAGNPRTVPEAGTNGLVHREGVVHSHWSEVSAQAQCASQRELPRGDSIIVITGPRWHERRAPWPRGNRACIRRIGPISHGWRRRRTPVVAIVGISRRRRRTSIATTRWVGSRRRRTVGSDVRPRRASSIVASRGRRSWRRRPAHPIVIEVSRSAHWRRRVVPVLPRGRRRPTSITRRVVKSAIASIARRVARAQVIPVVTRRGEVPAANTINQGSIIPTTAREERD
jgi:hypothetical protein